MRVTNIKHLEQDIDTVYAYYTNPTLIQTKREAFGARNIEVDVSNKNNQVTVVMNFEMPAKVSGTMSKFIKPWNKIRQTEVWTKTPGGLYKAQVKVESDVVPAKMNSTMVLTNVGKGCMVDCETEVNSNVPFVGKMLSKYVGETAQRAINGELKYIGRTAPVHAIV